MTITVRARVRTDSSCKKAEEQQSAPLDEVLQEQLSEQDQCVPPNHHTAVLYHQIQAIRGNKN
jgi:hypothetical protein